MKLKLTILGTSPRTFAEWEVRSEDWKQINGVSSTVFANNGTTEVKDIQKNKIVSISCNKQKIIPDEIITYTVKLDEKEKDKVKTEIKQVKFCLWFESKDKSGKRKKIEIDKKITPAGVILVRKRNDTPKVTNIFEPREDVGETLTENLDNAYYYANITYTENEAKLEIKYSKWMDGCNIRVEAYFKKILHDGGSTTASRWVEAPPEILDAYWMNAEGKKVNYAGYEQDLYLYLKTLGLRSEKIEVQVQEQDKVKVPFDDKKANELIEWKNNQIEIDYNGEALKQFKVGNKKR